MKTGGLEFRGDLGQFEAEWFGGKEKETLVGGGFPIIKLLRGENGYDGWKV